MFRIRRIYDDVIPANRQAIGEVQAILRAHFTGVRAEEIDGLPERLRNPFKQRFRTILEVAEDARGHVLGFALLLHEPQLHFSYLDFLASKKGLTGKGIGGALYERVRDDACSLGAGGLFFECLPDEPGECPDTELRRENAARLRFYERYGARPIVGTEYETPVTPGDDCMPHLVFGDLDRGKPLRRDFARKVVRAILERKYSHLCPPEYVERVVRSFADDPVRLREFRYVKREVAHPRPSAGPRERIAMIVNDRHEVHHVRERGYVEAPVRVQTIAAALRASDLVEDVPTRSYSDKHITAVHDADFVSYLRKACALVPKGRSVYPYVFPIRNAARPPKELTVRAGYYCIDTFTPLNQNAWLAARRAVDCTLTAADQILKGRRLTYALVRPPGHHAESRVFGGFCYFSNAAIAANYLSGHGRVAIIDVDYHHGNGQQEIFYERSDVLTVSIHGDPDFAYPYFSGFADETGAAAGEGFNLNLPLPEVQDGPQYRRALARALKAVADYGPDCLIVALGFDPAKGDPTGTWLLKAKDFEENGRMLGEMDLPTLVVQEGGYRTRTLGVNARQFFLGLIAGARKRDER